jgi:probable addiction module antidote protein
MAKLKTQPFDSARYLDSEEAVQEYLQATCEDGTPAEIAHALGVIARARNMTSLARKTGLTRQALYKALSGDGNPEFATIMKVAEALDLRLSFVSKAAGQDAA